MRFTVGELRVELAPLTKEAMPEFVSLAHGGGLQRRSVTRYMGMDAAPTAEDEEVWFDKTRAASDTLIWGIWLVDGEGKAATRTLIGNSALVDIDKDGHSKLIRQATSGSVIFRPEYWGKGIASAAHKARTWYAFTQLGLHRIKSAVIQANGGSRKALERSGYTLVYTERNEQYSDGQFHHLDCLECLNPLDLFWSQWWHGNRPTKASREARQRTCEVLNWADKNVELA
ncbi:MAG TPA: GNAT family protein [Dongiaceae bacterium]|nr:GNAT family protein [Dongiaceae bacterium]